MKNINIVFLITSLTFGCTGYNTNIVTQKYLLSKGFMLVDKKSETYEIKNIPLQEICKKLDFEQKELKPTLSQPPFSDVRIVKIRDLYFVVESEEKDQRGFIINNSLDNMDCLCTVSVSLKQNQYNKQKQTNLGPGKKDST